jgi:hypothetical protein
MRRDCVMNLDRIIDEPFTKDDAVIKAEGKPAMGTPGSGCGPFMSGRGDRRAVSVKRE